MAAEKKKKAASDSQTDYDFYYNDVTGLASSSSK